MRTWRRPHICPAPTDRKSTRLNSSHVEISYAVFCLKKKKTADGHAVGQPGAERRNTGPDGAHQCASATRTAAARRTVAARRRGQVLFFFNDTATTEISTLSLHDALPIRLADEHGFPLLAKHAAIPLAGRRLDRKSTRLNSSHVDLVCRLLLEKKNGEQVYFVTPVEQDETVMHEAISNKEY